MGAPEGVSHSLPGYGRGQRTCARLLPAHGLSRRGREAGQVVVTEGSIYAYKNKRCSTAARDVALPAAPAHLALPRAPRLAADGPFLTPDAYGAQKRPAAPGC